MTSLHDLVKSSFEGMASSGSGIWGEVVSALKGVLYHCANYLGALACAALWLFVAIFVKYPERFHYGDVEWQVIADKFYGTETIARWAIPAILMVDIIIDLILESSRRKQIRVISLIMCLVSSAIYLVLAFAWPSTREIGESADRLWMFGGASLCLLLPRWLSLIREHTGSSIKVRS